MNTPGSFSDPHNLLDPDQDIDEPQTEDGSFEKGICDNRTELGKDVKKIIVFPGRHPGERQESDSKIKRADDIEDIANPFQGAQMRFARLRCDTKEHFV